jgi:CheY-like chemotaxis protein
MTHLTSADIDAAGIDDLLVKPVPSGVLRSALLSLLDAPQEQAPARTEERAGSGRRVLIVEDNPVNQMVAAGLLEFLGYAHRTVEDGLAAVRAADEEDWDVILMDVQMPVLDGYAATRRIREREAEAGRRRTPVVAMTAAAIEGERERCLEAGMDDYLTKPVDPTALAASLAFWGGDIPQDDVAHTGAPEQERLTPVDPQTPDDGPLAGLDLERLEMLLELDPGSTAYLDRAIGNFMSNSVTGLEEMTAAIEAGDALALRQTSHRLAGGALNLGVTYAGEAVRRLEFIADEGTVDGAADLLGSTAEALARGREALAAYQAAYQAR